MKTFLAIAVCKLICFACKLLGKNGSAAPGNVSLRICPDILKNLSAQVKKEIFVVVGTNGKTTTTNLLADFMQTSGRVVSNRVGANMLVGVVTSFCRQASLFGKLDADYAVLEVDEASLKLVAAHLTPSHIVVTNLFRDQLDRYGEVDITADHLKQGFALAPNATLVLNTNEPMVAQFGREAGHPIVYYGITQDLNTPPASETVFCPLCGAALKYAYCHYAQLGKFTCTECDFASLQPGTFADDICFGDKTTFTLHTSGQAIDISTDYSGIYNVYNILGAVAAMQSGGGDITCIRDILSQSKPQTGRMEKFVIDEKPVIIGLSKNPAGFNSNIAALCQDPRDKSLLLAVNDNPSDGIDVSWLWDVDFESLCAQDMHQIVLSGKRAPEVSLRLKYAGIDTDKISILDDRKEAVAKSLQAGGAICYILANYTAMFDTHAILTQMLKGAKS